jgi:hypothetical protein
MTTRIALKDLAVFNSDPTTHNASHLVTIPALYDILMYERTHNGVYSATLLSICKWLCERGNTILEVLIRHTTPPINQVAEEETDWKAVRTCYDGMGWN